MSNLENITNKILRDAQNEATSLLEEAKKEADQALNARRNEAEKVKHTILDRAKREADQTVDRMISSATLKVRDENLRAKHTVMDRVFEEAKEKLRTLSDEDYNQYVHNILPSLHPDASMLFIPQEGRTKVETGIKGLPISKDQTVKAGFALLSDKKMINFIFDDMVEYNRLDIEGEIADRLFQEKE